MAGSIVLIIFGMAMILPIGLTDTLRSAADAMGADYPTRFMSPFVFLGISVLVLLGSTPLCPKCC